MQQIKLRIARLESILEEQSQKLNEKILYLKECEKRLDEMSEKIHSLQSTLSNMKADSLHAEKRVMALEEEVQLLWANLRRNNFDIHVLESKAQETEDRLGEVTSRVEKMGDIVSEQWIQVQHLEQALHIAKIRTRKAVRQAYFLRCTFLKFIDNLLSDLQALESYLFGKGTMSVVMNQLKRPFTISKMYHHELQGIIKDMMRSHKFTASFAHDELVFFLASALIIFPLMSAWILLSS
ncbi:hypothetical protein L6164_036730 [Bauhinia variegata]|uniref:Uncharacterized protein n=1 Tax=Bauhinia variegata TaxID=167791 RepID=A0ACB9KHZ9_BAUVA|nr:hypothetical protein L6164_036730 [Bauhinia variegata]